MADSAKRATTLPNLLVRVMTAGLVVPVLLYALYALPKDVFLWFGILFGVPIAAAEMAGMTMANHRIQAAWAIAASVGVYAMVYWQPTPVAVAATAVGVVSGGFLVGLAQPAPMETAGARMAWLVATPLYAGGLTATLPLLHRFDNGASWVVLAMVVAWAGDTGAYSAGRLFGKHKLYEAVSPQKTVEGAIGGLLGSSLGAVAIHFTILPTLPLLHAIPLALVAGCAGQIGDLTISLLKRSANVKDTGWVVPGHGGLLDRIDGLMMTSSVTWAYTETLL